MSGGAVPSPLPSHQQRVPDGYHRLAGQVDPVVVSRLLARWKWTQRQHEPDIREVWELADPDGAPNRYVLLPLDPSYADFRKRLADVLRTLGAVYGLEPHELDAALATLPPAREDPVATCPRQPRLTHI